MIQTAVIESEKNRRNDRLRGHYSNTVWEKRDSPPEDWNKELPEWFEKEREVRGFAIQSYNGMFTCLLIYLLLP